MLKVVFTCGDINGIGPEICLKTILQVFDKDRYKIILICPKNIFSYYSDKLNFNIPFKFISDESQLSDDPSYLTIISLSDCNMEPGIATAISGETAFLSLKKAIDLANKKLVDTIVTAPLSKKALHLAGYNYPGHTEILAELTGTNDYCMMFLSDIFIAALATIHIPVKMIASELKKEMLIKLFITVNAALEKDLAVKKPEIAVLGLNPHAGEEGKIGSEEKDIIYPAICETSDVVVRGPYVPDAFFGNKQYDKFDAVIGMYHDQVLIPFKLLNFEKGVNFTAGLPIIRTSPDHGTAYDIAGKILADPTSMIEAFNWAVRIAGNRKKNDES